MAHVTMMAIRHTPAPMASPSKPAATSDMVVMARVRYTSAKCAPPGPESSRSSDAASAKKGEVCKCQSAM